MIAKGSQVAGHCPTILIYLPKLSMLATTALARQPVTSLPQPAAQSTQPAAHALQPHGIIIPCMFY